MMVLLPRNFGRKTDKQVEERDALIRRIDREWRERVHDLHAEVRKLLNGAIRRMEEEELCYELTIFPYYVLQLRATNDEEAKEKATALWAEHEFPGSVNDGLIEVVIGEKWEPDKREEELEALLTEALELAHDYIRVLTSYHSQRLGLRGGRYIDSKAIDVARAKAIDAREKALKYLKANSLTR